MTELSDIIEARNAEMPSVLAAEAWLAGAPVLSLQEQIASWGEEYRSYRRTWDRPVSPHTVSDAIRLHRERDAFIHRFGFSCPNAEALDLLARHQPLLEVGAGSGLWTRLLLARGVDVIATDPVLEFRWNDRYPALPLAAKTAVRRWPERHVFCSWPSLKQTWLRQAARAMRPGRVLICVCEDAVADERTWDELDDPDRFEVIEDFVELIGWHYCHDHLRAWRKRGGRYPRRSSGSHRNDRGSLD